MTPFSDDELIDFVFGRPVERAEEIRRQLQSDLELSAQVELMCVMAGRPLPGQGAQVRVLRPRSTWKKTLRRVAAALVLLFMLGSMSWAAWYVLHTPPLLEDNFNDAWINHLLWYVPRPIVREEQGHLSLVNRGYVRSIGDFPGPISLSLRWRWRDLGGDPKYSDILSVALRTTGEPQPAHAYEIRDGIVVKLDAADGAVSIVEMPAGRILARTNAAALPMPAGAWHELRITDDGDAIAVYLRGPAIIPRQKDEPILRASCPGEFPAHRIAIYNRERLADVPHESHVDDVVLRPLP